MIEKETRTREDCPPKNGKSLSKLFAIIAAIATALVILQNVVVPLVSTATSSATATLTAKVETHGNRLTALETLMPEIKERLARIETKLDQAKVALDESKALAMKKGG